jgi:hypothetical protein
MWEDVTESAAPAEMAWASAVQVAEDPALAQEVGQRASQSPAVSSISVSDLLAPRRAFWRRRAPATPIAEDRRGRMEAGRGWHSRLILALPHEGAFEVRVRRDGIAGRIDLLADVPVEVKTGSPVGVDRLLELRPDHVEQIAMYCALAGAPTGRIVTLSRGAEDSIDVQAVDLRVARPEAVAAAMRGRADRIRAAVHSGQVGDLPACRWFGRRCEFEEARVCDCNGSEPAPSREILDEVGPIDPRPDLEGRWRESLRAIPAESSPDSAPRFRDLIYSRRAYFDRTWTGPKAPSAGAPPPRPPGPDLYERLAEAVEGGPVGEVARLAPGGAKSEEEVPGFRGAPYLLKTSRARSRIEAGEAVARFPQYALELGFRCVATGTAEGRVFLAFERAERETDRFEVLHYRFAPIASFRQIWDERAARLEGAVSAGAPERLPPCPGWMYETCPYRTVCGCVAEPGRSQR